MTDAEIALIRRVPIRWACWDGVVAESSEWVTDARMVVHKCLHKRRVAKLLAKQHPTRKEEAQAFDRLVEHRIPVGSFSAVLERMWRRGRGKVCAPYIAEFESPHGTVYLNGMFVRLAQLLIEDLTDVQVKVSAPHKAVWFTRSDERLVAIMPLRPDHVECWKDMYVAIT